MPVAVFVAWFEGIIWERWFGSGLHQTRAVHMGRRVAVLDR